MRKLTDKQHIQDWDDYRDNIYRTTPIDRSESKADQLKRIEHLEKHPEKWFKYYFPDYYQCEPAPFHITSTKRVLDNPEIFLVRSWARELSKTSRTMMEDFLLALTGQNTFIIEVSHTFDNAAEILEAYRVNFEKNQRITHDYGYQVTKGSWEYGEFKIKKGCKFLAIGAGQSPRGKKNENWRPNKINIDDIDTDEECRNTELIKQKVDWVFEALIPTRSISGKLRIVANGNIIAKYCTITELAKKADFHEIINIRDENGKSTWKAKNPEEAIDRVFSLLPWSSIQKEYFNNPVIVGKTFKYLKYGKCPPINKCEYVIVYSDPAPSNKADSGSCKATVIIGYFDYKFYLYKVWVSQMTTASFIDTIFDADLYLTKGKVDIKRFMIENNTLQNPHYEQVIKPAIKEKGKKLKRYVPVRPDTRDKKDKYTRIEGTMEPIHRLGEFIANIDEKDDPHMITFESQWLSVDPKSKTMDGPDAAEGGVWQIKNRTVELEDTTWVTGDTYSRKY